MSAMYTLIILLQVLTLFARNAVAALLNVTVDDGSYMIVYNGIWEPASEHQSGLDFGGAHTVSADRGASAVLKFTGVSIYYFAPLWPYLVTTQVSIDGGDSVVFNLTDPDASPTEGGSESAASSVIWAVTGLANTIHTVVVSMAPGGQFIVVDGFKYTVDDPTSGSSGTSAADDISVMLTSPTSAVAPPPSANSTSSTSDALPIALGLVLGGLMLFSAALLVWFVLVRPRRARRRSNVLAEWGTEHAPVPDQNSKVREAVADDQWRVDAFIMPPPPAYSPGSSA